MKVNLKQIRESLASSAIGAKRVNTVMERQFEREKDVFLQEFDSHPVTKLIQEGPDGDKYPDPNENLRGFIGFTAGSDPITPLRNALETGLNIKTVKSRGYVKGNKIEYTFYLQVDNKQIAAATPMPWETGLSWVFALEKDGISNFSQFLSKRGKGRSDIGIQLKASYMKGATFKTRPYVLAMIKALHARLRG